MEDTSEYLQNMENLGNNAIYYNNPGAALFGGGEKYDTLMKLNEMQYLSAVNANEAEKARDWSERLSNTEVSRRVKDLESVGFSPMALFGNVSGATTPGASMGTSSQAGAPIKHSSTDSFLGLLKVMGGLILGGAKLGAASSISREKMAQNQLLTQEKINHATKMTSENNFTKKVVARIMKGTIR